MRKMRPAIALAGALAALLAAAAAGAGPALLSSPSDTTLEVGDTARLSFRLEEVLDVRTVELWVHYDPAVITGVQGRPGQLLRESGALIFHDYDEPVPGLWHGLAVVMGSTVWVTGPGELYEWTFTAAAPGTTTVAADSLRLFDPEANLIDGTSLLPAFVKVVDPTLSEVPRAGGCGLSVYPNPFNPRASIRVEMPAAGTATLEVLDLTGRRLDVLLDRPLAAGTSLVTWDGTDAAGRRLSSGVYLFRLRGSAGEALSRGVLVR